MLQTDVVAAMSLFGGKSVMDWAELGRSLGTSIFCELIE